MTTYTTSQTVSSQGTYDWKWDQGLGIAYGRTREEVTLFAMRMAKDFAVQGKTVYFFTCVDDDETGEKAALRLQGRFVQTWPQLGNPTAGRITALNFRLGSASTVLRGIQQRKHEVDLVVFEGNGWVPRYDGDQHVFVDALNGVPFPCLLSYHTNPDNLPVAPSLPMMLDVNAYALFIVHPRVEVVKHNYQKGQTLDIRLGNSQ